MLSVPMRLTIISFYIFHPYWYLHSRHYYLTIPEEIKRHAKYERAGRKKEEKSRKCVQCWCCHFFQLPLLPSSHTVPFHYFFSTYKMLYVKKRVKKKFNHRQMVNKSCSVIMNKTNNAEWKFSQYYIHMKMQLSSVYCMLVIICILALLVTLLFAFMIITLHIGRAGKAEQSHRWN